MLFSVVLPSICGATGDLVAKPGLSSVAITHSALQASGLRGDEVIRVRVFNNVPKLRIQGVGLRIVGRPLDFSKEMTPNSVLPRQGVLAVQRKNNKWLIKGGDEFPLDVTSGDRTVRVTGNFLKVNGEPSADDIVLVAHGDSIQAISLMGLDQYLRGVLPSEMPASWPIETLKAQAIAARSYALSLMRENMDSDYDVDDSTNHQVYKMANFLRSNSHNQRTIEQAILETRDIRLIDSRGQPYRTYYHADCGGHTEEPSLVWNGGAQYGTVKDEGCALSPRGGWSAEVDRKTLAAYIKKKLGLNFLPEVIDVEIIERAPSGRALKLKALLQVSGDSEKSLALEHYLSGEELRRVYGYNRVRSTQFEMRMTGGQILITGRGHGHGVGLCQNGAKFMAMAGQSAQAIIRRYYPHAKLKTAQELLAMKARVDGTRL